MHLAPVPIARPLPSLPALIGRRALGAATGWPQTVVFVDARALPHHAPPAEDPAARAPRLAPAAEYEDVRYARPARDASWIHQALTPLPTEGYLAMRAATAAYRKTA